MVGLGSPLIAYHKLIAYYAIRSDNPEPLTWIMAQGFVGKLLRFENVGRTCDVYELCIFMDAKECLASLFTITGSYPERKHLILCLNSFSERCLRHISWSVKDVG